MSDHDGYCQLCKPERRVELSALLEHLRVVHGVTDPPLKWQDGSLVVFDRTLEPADFEEEK